MTLPQVLICLLHHSIFQEMRKANPLRRKEYKTLKNTAQFHIRPARPNEAGLFYTPHPEEDKRLGTIGHVRMDFGKSGNEFWHTWHPRGAEELNSPAFKAELQQVVDKLREDVLKNRFAMERFCYEHGGKINGGWTQNYGYIVETEHYQYCLRCNPSPGDYNAYLTCFDLDVQRQNMRLKELDELGKNIREWYAAKFPSDELSSKIHDISFYDLIDCMNHGENVYEILGVKDSIVRERVFDEAAQLLHVDYDVVYKKWLYGAGIPEIVLPSRDGQSMKQERPAIGRVSFVSGEKLEFADMEAFLNCIREELPYRPMTGFHFEVLTDDPTIRKAVDDMILDFYGEENPSQLENYQKPPEQGMTIGGIGK